MTIRFTALLFLASTFCFAGTWSGVLVDSGCFRSEANNVTKDATPARWDVNMAVRACTPSAKTKHFGVVLPDSQLLTFNAAGNASAARFVASAAVEKGKRLPITVSGTLNKKVIDVGSVSAAGSAQ